MGPAAPSVFLQASERSSDIGMERDAPTEETPDETSTEPGPNPEALADDLSSPTGYEQFSPVMGAIASTPVHFSPSADPIRASANLHAQDISEERGSAPLRSAMRRKLY